MAWCGLTLAAVLPSRLCDLRAASQRVLVAVETTPHCRRPVSAGGSLTSSLASPSSSSLLTGWDERCGTQVQTRSRVFFSASSIQSACEHPRIQAGQSSLSTAGDIPPLAPDVF